MIRNCKTCNLDKDLEEFSKSGEYKGTIYYMANCKPRHNEHIKEKYKNNEGFRQRAIKTAGQYQKDNPIKMKEYRKKWYKDHPRYFTENIMGRYHTIPEFKLHHNMRTRLNEILKKTRTNKNNNVIDLLGCSLKELKSYIEQQFEKEMEWKNHGNIWEIDHIHPLSKEGSFHYSNLQPLFKTTEIAESFGYVGYTGNRNKSNKI